MSANTSLPSRNVELKARCGDLRQAHQRCRSIGAADAGLLIQVDTYFHVRRGRLKLRQIEGARSELICYSRPDHSQPRSSDYRIVPIDDAEGLKQALTTALGVMSQVKKRRELLLWENVRIHLDQVEGLGHFIELEAVLSGAESESEGHARIAKLRKLLSINDQDLVPQSYSDLQIAAAGPV
jgi:predicted adenylyl cyclase CyaB